MNIKNINAAFIYGSYAKDSSNAKSDIDLLIIGAPDEDALIDKINALEKTLKREINYSIYSKPDFKKKKSQKDPFISDVIKNKKLFLVGDENDFR